MEYNRLLITFRSLPLCRQCGYKVHVRKRSNFYNTTRNTTTYRVLSDTVTSSRTRFVLKRDIWLWPFRSMTADKVRNFWVKGLVSAPVTPFDEKGDLNLSILSDYVRHFQQYGIRNAFVTGTTGEGQLLTVPERKQVAEAWVKEGKGKLSAILVHVGATNLRDCQELAAHAQQIGADAVACVGPTYHKPQTLEQYVYYMRDVAAAAPDLPFYLYDIDFYTGIPFTAEQFFSIAQHHIPTLKGVKHTTLDFSSIQSLLDEFGDKYQILMGTDESYLSGLVVGVHGNVCSTFCGGALNRMQEAFAAGNIDEARKEQRRARSIAKLYKKYSFTFPGGTKAILRAIGLPVGQPRCPLEPIPESTIKSLNKDLEKLGFYEWGPYTEK